MDIFIDYETHWDKDTYTLGKMSNEAYVRDQRFEAQLLSIAVDNDPVYVCEPQEIGYVLDHLPLNSPGVRVIAHNMKFDGFITTDHFKKRIGIPICTRAMARWTGVSRVSGEGLWSLSKFFGTTEKGNETENTSGLYWEQMSPELRKNFKAYAGNDVEILRNIYYSMLPFMTDDAMQFIAMTEQMYIHPMLILDYRKLDVYEYKIHAKFVENQQRIQHLFNFSSEEDFLTNIRSADKFKQMLEALNCPVPMKFSKKKTKTARNKAKENIANLLAFRQQHGGELDAATSNELEAALERFSQDAETSIYIPAVASVDIDFLELQDHPDENISTLVTVKLASNSPLQLTRAKTLKGVASRGPLPVPLEAFKAWTGRYTAGNADDAKSDAYNLQNLDKRKGDKGIRETIMAPAGYKLVAADSSQIEARTGAVLANQWDLVEAFANDEDVYCDLAGTIYGLPPEEIRYWAKGAGASLDADKHKAADKQRFVGKTGILSSQYQISGYTYAIRLLQDGIWLGDKGDREYHDSEGRRHNSIYRNKYALIVKFWGICEYIISELFAGNQGWFGGPDSNIFYYDGRHEVFGKRVPGIMFPDGYWLVYPNLRRMFDEESEREVWKYDQLIIGKNRNITLWPKTIYGGQLFNNINQGVSSSVLRWQALRLREEGFPIIMNVHDEWMTMVFDALVEIAKERMEYWLKQVPPWFKAFIPLACEVKTGQTYAEL